MSERIPAHGLDAQGIRTGATLHWNLGTAPLVEEAVERGEGKLTAHGALLVDTGKFTGRSVKDKYIVRDAATEDTINWGPINQPMSVEHWANLKADFMAALGEQEELYVADLFGGSQPEYRVNVRVINQMAWHNLFIRTLLVRPSADELRRLRSRIYDHQPAQLQGRSGAPRLPQRHGDRGQLHRQVDPDRQHRIFGRDEEGRVRPAQLPAPRAGRDADALLGQHRRRRQERDLLRPVGHRQDHAVGRRQPHPDRRRRTWLVGPGGVQLRRRLLRQDDQPVGRGRAGNLRHDPDVRHDPRECRDGRGDARARLHRRQQDREYARCLSDRISSRTCRNRTSARRRRTSSC